MDQVICNVKGVIHSEKLSENYNPIHFQLIAMVLWPATLLFWSSRTALNSHNALMNQLYTTSSPPNSRQTVSN